VVAVSLKADGPEVIREKKEEPEGGAAPAGAAPKAGGAPKEKEQKK